MRPRRAALQLGLAAALAGCGGWLGERDSVPLPGERIPVLLLDEGVRADPRLANLDVVLPAPVANAEWSQAGGSPSHAMQHLAAGARLSEAWRAGIGAGSSRRVRLIGQPVVADGRVFTVDAEGRVGAFATADGRELWRHWPEGVEGSDRLGGGGLAHADGRLFVAFTHGDVVALDPATGAELWRQKVRAPVRTGPAAAGGRVLVVTADNQLFALDGDSGEILWRHQGIAEQAGILGAATPAVAGDAVVVTYSSGEVYGIRLVDGRPVWSETVLRPRRTLAIGAISDITGEPVIDGERVIVAGAGGETAAFDLMRGLRAWSVDVTSRQMPWVAGEFIFVLTDRNEVVCLLRQGGRIRWVSPLPRQVDPEDADSGLIYWVGPVLAGDRLVLASSTGQVASVSPYTGEMLGTATLRGPVSLAPVVAEETVFFLTDDGELLAYR